MKPLGWLFTGMAALFAAGLLPRCGRWPYPDSAPLAAKLAAPVIFAGLALACFHGAAMMTMGGVAVVGIGLIIVAPAKAK